jgi:UDP-N-acetylglucosamine--N-acetylmuramyl-(pentapeptide) pyrophosphoryl-undecaprenol N-acetylglucosamine transferase
MRILIAAGGTGGHIFPALAVLQCLRERDAELRVRWVGGHRGFESSVVPGSGVELDRLWLRSLRTVDLSVATILDPFRLGASVPQAAAMLARWRPDAVFTTGGYVAIPVLMTAAAARIPSLLWEGNRIAGRSVRATARMATALAVTFEQTCASLPDPCFVTGTPIRSLRGLDAAMSRARLGLAAGVHCLLVFGGSQAVRRLNGAVTDALPRLVERVQVVHVTGEPAYAGALRQRDALPPEHRARYRPFPFLRHEMTDALASADLVVGRAGSSTLAEATALGLPMVVVPYPHAAAHQAANAREVVDAGAAELIPDERFDGPALIEAASILDDHERLARMRQASRALGRPGAAGAVTELLLCLAEGRTLPGSGQVERLAREAA